MKKIKLEGGFYLTCRHCNSEYDLVEAKRGTPKREPIRCPSCGQIVAK